MLCELLTYRKAKDMYMREYNQLISPNIMAFTTGMNMGNSNNNNNNN